MRATTAASTIIPNTKALTPGASRVCRADTDWDISTRGLFGRRKIVIATHGEIDEGCYQSIEQTLRQGNLGQVREDVGTPEDPELPGHYRLSRDRRQQHQRYA